MFNDSSNHSVTCDNLFSVDREGAMNTREAIDYDLEFLYESARSVHKLPSNSQEDTYLARVRELVIDRKLSVQAAISKAFNEVML
jgi:hypothetical protein